MASNKEKLGPVIAFRLPATKHDEYQAAALTAGVSLSAVVRQCLAETSPQIIVSDGSQRRGLSLSEMERMAAAAATLKKHRPSGASEEKRELLYLFNSINNSMSELVRTAHAAERAKTANAAAYDGILAELQALTDLMHQAVADVD